MSPQRMHELPNGDRVIVIDTQTASQNLGKLLRSFRDGNEEPLIFSDTGEPEAVVIPFNQWLTLLDVADEAAADERIREITRQRLDSASRDEYVPLEEFLPPDRPSPKDGEDG